MQTVNRAMHEKSIQEYKKLILYILHIDDSMIRQIIFFEIHTRPYLGAGSSRDRGGGNSPDSIRMMMKRYLAKCNMEIQS